MQPTAPHPDPPGREPRQGRSRRTRAAILDAVEALLVDRPFEDVSIADVVARAGCSVGAFYGRFTNKDALLPALYARYDVRVHEMAQALDRANGPDTTLRDLVEGWLGSVVRLFRDNRYFMRAMALHARTNADSIPEDVRARRSALHAHFCERLLAREAEIAHPNPRLAVETGLFFVSAACRDKILFAEAPHAAATELRDEDLLRELTLAFLRYLGVESADTRKNDPS